MSNQASKPVIALLTDFGLQDWYVGSMKGVIKSICPSADIIDVSHGIAAQSIVDGSTMLSAAYRFFPPGTIFVAVVDPGVGSLREPVIVWAEERWFVAPNNGLLGFLMRSAPEYTCRKISNFDYCLETLSSTFHGRDIFSPCAAHLANGVDVKLIAPEETDLIGAPTTAASYDDGVIEGNIIYFDHFGNAITNIAKAMYDRYFGAGDHPRITVNQFHIEEISTTYSDVAPGALLAYWGSMEHLEIGINRGSARNLLELKLLDKLVLRNRDLA